MSASTGFAADKYLCKWTNAQGTNKVVYTPGMTKESYCANSKYMGDAYYKNCTEKVFPEIEKLYNEGKCKKYLQKIHENAQRNAMCVVNYTYDKSDGFIIQCDGPNAAQFKPTVEALYK